MKHEVERLKGKVKFSFIVPAEEWDQEITKVYNRTKHKYNIPGFRKGHATRRMIENTYGAGVFFDDAFNLCFRNSYSIALDANPDIYPVDEPQVDIEDMNGDGIKFSAVVTIKPEVKLGSYTGLTIPKVEYKVKKEEIDAEIEHARNRASRKVEVTGRPIKDGDIVTLDYSGSTDGVKFDGGTAENQELVIGSNSFIPGFEAQMIGMNIGETKDLNVKFPDEYHSEELKGKDAVFTVTVHGIKMNELPEADDNFAKDVSKFETLKEYREDIEANLSKEHERRAEMENENAILDAVTATAEIEIPEIMIESQIDYIVDDFKTRLTYVYQGMKFEDYLGYTGSDLASFRKERRDEALKNVKTRLVIEEIIKKEKIELTAEDVDKKIAELAEQAGKSTEEYRGSMGDRQFNYVQNDLIIGKMMDFLKTNNTFELKGETKPKAAKQKDTAAKTKKTDK